jgi:autotransporter translocation and assembly factor TamB
VNLADCHLEVARVLAVLAVHGQENRASAEAAFRAGMESLPDRGDVVMPMVTDWIATLDTDLPRLDQLGAMEKQQFTGALFRTVTFDGSAVPAELELLRVICSLVHVPLPMLTGNVANPAGPP